MTTKIVYLVTKKSGMTDDDFVDHWTTIHAGLAQQMPVQAYSINLPSPEQRGPRPLDGYAMLKFDNWAAAKAAWDTPAGQATANDGTLFMDSARPSVVDERRVVEPTDPEASMIKIVYLVTKRSELSDAQFVEHWTTTHAALAQHMPGLRAYSINLPSPEQRGRRPLDGYAMLKFDDWAAAKAAWQTAAGKATAQDGTRFMASARALIVDERKVVG